MTPDLEDKTTAELGPDPDRFAWSDLYRKEDWWAIWLGFLLLAAAFGGLMPPLPTLPDWSWAELTSAMPLGLLGPLAGLALGLGLLFGIGVYVMKPAEAKRFLPAFLVLFTLTVIACVAGKEKVSETYGIAYAFWAVTIGLLISNTLHTPSFLRPALRTEFYIKTGLVILGAEILFNKILQFGLYGLVIAWGVTPIVIIFMWLFGTRVLRMANKPLVIVIATATSVCGVSAAIAAAAASRAKREDLTIAVGMSLMFTVLMMMGMPVIARATGMDPALAGAWIGGTVDSTGAVAAAGAAYGGDASDTAKNTAVIVKMIQNILIGVVAFFIAIYWVTVIEKNPMRPQVGLGEIWTRFPKFILGFIGASLLVSFVAVPLLSDASISDALKQTKNLHGWLFGLAFLSIGLESNFKEMAAQMSGGKPIVLYVVGQLFNIVLTLLVAWIVLSGMILPPPPAL